MSSGPKVISLNPNLYSPTEDEVTFFKSQTGIESDEELREHILKVQKDAWNVVHYVCIQAFGFTKLRIRHLPTYPSLMQLVKERPDAIFLDYACAFGVDTRVAIADGYPAENVVASDLQKPLWEIGHKLFRSTAETFPVPFIQGDIFDPLHIAPAAPHYSPPVTQRPSLSTLTSLTPLEGHVSAIHAALFFHLFQEEGQLAVARALASLLSPLPGSLIFGSHSGLPVAGLKPTPTVRGDFVYCHSPESWRSLWDGVVFEKGTVEVVAKLAQPSGASQYRKMMIEDKSSYLMTWSVKRL